MARKRTKEPYYLTEEAKDTIVAVLLKQGVSQRDVALQLGMPAGTLSARLHGTIGISPIQAITLYDALEKPDELKFLHSYGTSRPGDESITRFFVKNKDEQSIGGRLDQILSFVKPKEDSEDHYDPMLKPYFMEIQSTYVAGDRVGKLAILNGLDEIIRKYADVGT